MTPQLQQLQSEFQERKNQAKAMHARVVSQAEAEGRPITPSELASVKAIIDEANGLKSRIDRASGDAKMLAELDRLTGDMTASASPRRRPSIGQQILDSEMGHWLRENRGKFPTGTWTSPSSELSPALMATTLDESAGSGGDLVITDTRPGIQPLPTRALVVADLIAPGTTDSNSVTYMQETLITNAAAAVAEGAAKPESTIVFNAVTDLVRKIATWIPITEELLSDVPAMAAFLDMRLRMFVQLTEDDQLLNGSGVAPNILGLMNRPGLAAAIARVAETNADVILKQISAIETAQNLPVDGVVMHPNNWDAVLLLKDADGNYIAGGGPLTAPGPKTLWGRRVATTTAIVANTALVGAFGTASQFFRRGGLRVETSNSHSDFFTKNLIAVRAEERGALAVYREAAFGKVTNLSV